MKLPHNFVVYETSYGNDIPCEQLFLTHFDAVPSKLANKTMYDPKIIDRLKEMGFVEVVRVSSSRRNENSWETVLVNQDKNIFVVVSTRNESKNDLVSIEFLYNLLLGELSEQLNLDDIKSFERQKRKANINLVKSEMGHMDTEEYDLHIPDMDLTLNYGEEFTKVHDVIIERLNKPNDKGIILLHGDPGTGKTSYIKYLTKLIKDKVILFIPPSMAEMLSEPSFIPFLMDHRNSILIIEDAERVISDREGNGSPAGVSNILNLTDGILGDCLNIQVIATFNMKKEKIDQALLRKGRLIAEHKFEKLSVDETNKLLKFLEKDHVSEEGMVLADIYNIDVEVHKSSKNKGSKIGF
jgi:SpoVK/Ycf46/Vps4 family AAA+-type ATPase